MRKRDDEKKKDLKGLGQYNQEDDFGVKMGKFDFDKADKLVIDSSKVIETFNNEEFQRKD